jgi:hypothetical protein
MNREAHLRQSLLSWLTLPGLGEVLIVDWTNARPLCDLCSLDPRIRVVRVEGEPRWILSYAYNLGVAKATHEHIFKCDSDCMPTAEAVAFEPGPDFFFAGYWKSGHAHGKPSVNGQCSFSKTQFETVNGYSEYIRTYGRDDEDFYDRMITAGFARRELTPEQLNFIPHTDEERTSNQFSAPKTPSLEETILRHPSYNEMFNLFISRTLPWSQSCRKARFIPIDKGDSWERLQRDPCSEPVLPETVRAQARVFALQRVVVQTLKLSDSAAQRLDEKSCLALLRNRARPPQGK